MSWMSVLSLLAEYLNPVQCRTNFNPIFFSHGTMIYYLIELNKIFPFYNIGKYVLTAA